jgi:hypothetical protein
LQNERPRNHTPLKIKAPLIEQSAMTLDELGPMIGFAEKRGVHGCSTVSKQYL